VGGASVMYKFFTYFSSSYIRIWLTTVFGFLVLIGLLDSLANGGDIIGNGGKFTDTFKYMAYRAPVIFDRIFVFTLVVAILLSPA
jgi:lipopolysaccharide export system permease protein